MNIKGTNEFPKIYRVGSSDVEDILSSAVEITEKIDGSQIGFGLVDGSLFVRSKGAALDPLAQGDKGLFANASQSILKCKEKLVPGWFYYGEALQSKRHNKLVYDQIPKGNIALFGVKKEDGSFINEYKELQSIAEQLEIDVVPLVYSGVVDVDELDKLMSETKSAFGAPYIEGIVIKNYAIPGNHSSIMVGKVVAEEFREVKKDRKPKGVGHDIEDKVRSFFKGYATQSRWDKAIQHFKERNALSYNTSDIGPLIKEIQQDVFEEEGKQIKEELWEILKKEFYRELVKGFAEYYMGSLKSTTKN